MHIAGYWGRSDAPYVSVLLISESLGIRRRVEFLIDTGTSHTAILDRDASRLGIDYSWLRQARQSMAGVGGMVETFIMADVKLRFRTEDMSIHEESMPEVLVLRHQAEDAERLERVRVIPSLLGRDLINRYRFVLHRSAGRVVITDELITI